jgi:alpha-D-ribose 1-methylphosphonate 5-triphosphate synthase subunit PhnL
VQARLLDLLRGLVVELNLAVVIVTHDLGVARLLADRLLVMKQGQVVESGLTDRVLDDPHHPYTQLLVSSVLQKLRLPGPTHVGRVSEAATRQLRGQHDENVSKTFVLHQQNGVRLPVLQNASLEVNAGECVVLHGHSGSGKSTLLRSCTPTICRTKAIFISATTTNGWIWSGPARKVLEVRRSTIGWVSQFLRVIPRISALDVVMQPLLDLGCRAKPAPPKPPAADAPQRAGTPVAPCAVDLFRRRAAAVNIARGFRSTTRFYSWMNPPPRWTQKQRCRGGTDRTGQSARRGDRRDLP